MKYSSRIIALPVTLLILILAGCGGGGGGGGTTPPPGTTTYTIGGSVTGPSGTGLVLQNNGGNNLTINALGSFTFATPIASGGAYSVTVFTQPTNPAQTCTVTNGSGTVASVNITNVAVNCTTPVALTPPLVLTTKTLPVATTGTPYSQTLGTFGNGAFQWNGVTIAPDSHPNNNISIGTSTGTVSGTPFFSGTQPAFFTLAGANDSVGIQYDLNIGGSGSSQNITNSPTTATQGTAYNFAFSTTWLPQVGCNPSLTFVFGSIPPGLSLNLLGGTFSGTPIFAGQYTMTLFGGFAGNTACAPLPTNFRTVTLTINPAASPTTPLGSSNWVRQGASPVLSPAVTGWDDFLIGSPAVVKVGATYYLFYEGQNSTNYLRAIGLATSTDGITWTKSASNPVLTEGTSGAWDAGGVRYPSIHHDGTTFRMYYQGRGTTGTKIGLTTSADGVTWVKHASNPVISATSLLSAYAPGSVVHNGSQFVMFYSASGSIGRMTSTDGIAWVDSGSVFNPVGVRFSKPSVILDGTTYRMYYTRLEELGSGAGNANAVYPITIGYADSPDGIAWTTYGNPIFTAGSNGAWDRPAVGVPSVIKDGTAYKMWYAGGRGNLPGTLWDANAFVEGAIGHARIP